MDQSVHLCLLLVGKHTFSYKKTKQAFMFFGSELNYNAFLIETLYFSLFQSNIIIKIHVKYRSRELARINKENDYFVIKCILNLYATYYSIFCVNLPA